VADRYCGSCGHVLSPDDGFCPSCGRHIHQNASVSTPEAEVTVTPSTGREEAQPKGGETVDNSRDEELALREADARNALVAKALKHGIFDWDLRTGAVSWDDKCLRLLGLSHRDSGMAYEDFLQLVHPEDRQKIREAVSNHLERGTEFAVEYRVRHADGGYRSVISRAETERDHEGKALRMVGILDDVTERKALEEQLQSMAFHDPLTALPNRALFMDRLKHALDRSERQEAKPAVLFVDLDNFKNVNDSLGHEAGDRALVAVAERLRGCVRPGDTVARLGGDEFTVLLEEAGEAEARRVAERILEKLGAPIVIDERRFCLTPSIGMAFSGSGTRPADLLRDADAAMYEAKRAGKARYDMFPASVGARVAERSNPENDLRRAIEREEFIVHYQPKVLLSSLGVFALEALVRWEHPQRGLIPPDEFIPLAEETGLIVPIGDWVLRQACGQMKAWQDQHPSRPPLVVNVNLSPRQFRQPDLGESIARVLLEAGLDPGCLVLEVTESALMEDSHAAGATLQRLSSLGVSIAIDDFGTAYSSLARLKHLPIDTLKVDRSFVAGLGEDEEDEVLVSGILSMASGLGLSVVAEGVETSKQLARLRALGCSMAQGYYFSKPLPRDEAAWLLES
jgi:diguanylate cyclase (GGDEF)-like protein/PAS domain S-box-containing protein